MVSVADHLLLGVFPTAAQTGRYRLAASAAGAAIHRQADEATLGEHLVALGSAQHAKKSLAAAPHIQSFGEICQRVIAKDPAHQQGAASRDAHQGFHTVKGAFAKQLAEEQCPKQSLGRNLRILATVSGSFAIRTKAEPPLHKKPQ